MKPQIAGWKFKIEKLSLLLPIQPIILFWDSRIAQGSPQGLYSSVGVWYKPYSQFKPADTWEDNKGSHVLPTTLEGWAVQRQTEMSKFKTFLPKTLYESGINREHSVNSPLLVSSTKSWILWCYTLKLMLIYEWRAPSCIWRAFTPVGTLLSPWYRLREGGEDAHSDAFSQQTL